MEIKEKRPKQADLVKQASGLDRSARGPIGKLTLVAFLGYSLVQCSSPDF